ncbi:MAG TPA: bifunctional riboflavin kinase/FAD synthetase [Chloroflexota bacterium]|nr:bifunctional riboflavin kinase/FAD synthetase [Chloroflexota bacterium]
MRVVRRIADVTPGRRFAVTIGAFDGVHLGHQSLFRKLQEQARQHEAGTLAITFDPDPSEVVSPNPPPYLSDLDQKIELIEAQGIDELCIVHFDERIKNLSAQEFMDPIVAAAVVVELVVGHDFAMGHDRHGTRTVLEQYAEQHRFAFAVAEELKLDGQGVSATRIRRLLTDGDVTGAARLLGRFPCIRGPVVEGDKRGRLIGFPTANLGLQQRWAIPADGVYVAYTHLQAEKRQSAVNIGMRPTFDAKQRTIESHILDFSGDIYGEDIAVEFLHRLRGEQKFSGIEEIREQIGRDVQAAREYFGKPRSTSAPSD